MRKNIVFVWILGIFALSITLFTFHVSSSAQSTGATKLFVFNPFTAKCGLKSEFVVITRAGGVDCTIQADANKGRSNAFRCTAGTLNLDPCFADEKILACFVSPWNKKVVVLEPSKPLPKKPFNINTGVAPWAVELTDGSRCSYLAGEDTNIRDMRVNYSCSRDIYILGDIDQSKATWYARVYNSKNDTITYLPIVNAWY